MSSISPVTRPVVSSLQQHSQTTQKSSTGSSSIQTSSTFQTDSSPLDIVELGPNKFGVIFARKVQIYDCNTLDKPLGVIKNDSRETPWLYQPASNSLASVSENRLSIDDVDGRRDRITIDLKIKHRVSAMACLGKSGWVFVSDCQVIFSPSPGKKSTYLKVATLSEFNKVLNIYPLGEDGCVLVCEHSITSVHNLKEDRCVWSETHAAPLRSAIKCSQLWGRQIVYLSGQGILESSDDIGIFNLDDFRAGFQSLQKVEGEIDAFTVLRDGRCLYLHAKGLTGFNLENPEQRFLFSLGEDAMKMTGRSVDTVHRMKTLSNKRVVMLAPEGRGLICTIPECHSGNKERMRSQPTSGNSLLQSDRQVAKVRETPKKTYRERKPTIVVSVEQTQIATPKSRIGWPKILDCQEGRVGFIGDHEIYIYRMNDLSRPLRVFGPTRSKDPIYWLYLGSDKLISVRKGDRSMYDLANGRVETIEEINRCQWMRQWPSAAMGLGDGRFLIASSSPIHLLDKPKKVYLLSNPEDTELLQVYCGSRVGDLHPLTQDAFVAVSRNSIARVQLKNKRWLWSITYHILRPSVERVIIHTQVWQGLILYLFREGSEDVCGIGIFNPNDPDASEQQIKQIRWRVEAFAVLEDGFCLYPHPKGLAGFYLANPDRAYILSLSGSNKGLEKFNTRCKSMKVFSGQCVVTMSSDGHAALFSFGNRGRDIPQPMPKTPTPQKDTTAKPIIQVPRAFQTHSKPRAIIELGPNRIGFLCDQEIAICDRKDLKRVFYVIEGLPPEAQSLYLSSPNQLLCMSPKAEEGHMLYTLGDDSVHGMCKMFNMLGWRVIAAAALPEQQYLFGLARLGRIVLVWNGDEYRTVMRVSDRVVSLHPLEGKRFAVVYETKIAIVTLRKKRISRIVPYAIPGLPKDRTVLHTQVWKDSILYLYREPLKGRCVIGRLNLDNPDASSRVIKELTWPIDSFTVLKNGTCLCYHRDGLAGFDLSQPHKDHIFALRKYFQTISMRSSVMQPPPSEP